MTSYSNRKGLTSATAFRLYLRTTHGLHIILNKRPKVEKESNRLTASFNIQQQRAESTAEALKARVLRDSVNQANWLNVLVMMIVNHNLPYTIFEWPKFYLLIKISNYTLVKHDGPVKKSCWSVRKLLGKIYKV